jgi:hypothetical protein
MLKYLAAGTGNTAEVGNRIGIAGEAQVLSVDGHKNETPFSTEVLSFA